MATVTEFAPGQIASAAGADKLRGELLSAHVARCGDAWMAESSVYADGAAEITVSVGYDRARGAWRQHEYYYSFEMATRALVAFEQSGALLTEDEL